MKHVLLLSLSILLISSCGQNPAIDYVLIPTAEFTVSKNDDGFYASSAFTVQDESYDAHEVSWDFGDGNIKEGFTVEHSYATKGRYTIIQTACNGGVCDVSEKVINVKDDIKRLLAGEESKTWVLNRWTDQDGNPVDFDSCLSCVYAQTFYATTNEDGTDGEHKWLNSGLRVCGEETLQCNTYGPQGHGWFYFDLDPQRASSTILIGTASKTGYEIVVDETTLHLSSGDADFYYEVQ